MRRAATTAVLAIGGAVAASCAGAPASGPAPAAAACEGLTPPRRINVAPVELPASFLSARVGGEVVNAVLLDKDGSVRSVEPVRARFEGLAPFGEASVRKSQFTAGAFEGNPVAVRGTVTTLLGVKVLARAEPEYDTVWAHVAAGESREARWHLAGSVSRLTVSAHAGTPRPEGGEIVARAPDGGERVLHRLPASSAPADVKETVATGRFFARPGDYLLELRAGGRALAETTLTIASDFQNAVVNACAPIESAR